MKSSVKVVKNEKKSPGQRSRITPSMKKPAVRVGSTKKSVKSSPKVPLLPVAVKAARAVKTSPPVKPRKAISLLPPAKPATKKDKLGKSAQTAPAGKTIRNRKNISSAPAKPTPRNVAAPIGAKLPATKRVLLLEDDVMFNQIISGILKEEGFEVVSVKNGIEGIRQVLAKDFDVILCDMLMPGLPGDLFYRAVERAKQGLCERFLFMSGKQNDPNTNAFIDSIEGTMLFKPFSMNELLEAVRAISKGEKPKKKVVPKAAKKPEPPPFATADNVPALSLVGDYVPVQVIDPLSSRRSLGLRLFVSVVVAILILVALTAFATGWYVDLRARVAATASEKSALEGWNAELASQLPSARSATAQAQAMELASRQNREALTTPRWTPIIRAAMNASGDGIELLNVEARDASKSSDLTEIRIRGMATGTEPRLKADRFCKAVESIMAQTFPKERVEASFKGIEDVNPQAGDPDGNRKVAFAIYATRSANAAPTPKP